MSAEKDVKPTEPADDQPPQPATHTSESETAASEQPTDAADTSVETMYQLMEEIDTDSGGRMPIGPARFNGRLLLKEVDTGKTYTIANDALQEVLIGRLDRATGFRPTIDLTELDARHRGVSRRHATIHEQDTVLVVTDHNSMNGTYLNSERLVPEQRRLLRHGDILRIGKIDLRVIFEK